MSDYGMEDMVYKINFEAARLACDVITSFENSHEPVSHFVAGSLARPTEPLQCRPMSMTRGPGCDF